MIISEHLKEFNKARFKAWLFFQIKSKSLALTGEEEAFMELLEKLFNLPIFDFLGGGPSQSQGMPSATIDALMDTRDALMEFDQALHTMWEVLRPGPGRDSLTREQKVLLKWLEEVSTLPIFRFLREGGRR